MEGLVYKIENKINGKLYIGITSKGISGRYPGRSWKVSNTRSRLVKKAMTKYGADNFELSIIERCNVTILEEREVYYISKYSSLVPNGYNLTTGGNYNRTLSQETKNKIALSKKGIPSWNTGLKMPEGHKEKCRLRMKGKIPWNKGKKTGPMSSEHIKRSAKGHYKPVKCLDLEGNLVKVYDSLKDTKKDGFDPCQVCLVCKGKTKTHRKHRFEYYINN